MSAENGRRGGAPFHRAGTLVSAGWNGQARPGYKEIMIMHKNTIPQNTEPIVVCDIDGTIARMHPQREALYNGNETDWKAFYQASFDDAPIDRNCSLVRHFSLHHRVVFCTSRSDTVYGKTLAWLHRNLQVESFPHGYDLLMRCSLDPRPDTVVKPELLEAWKNRHGASVLCVLEDSPEMQDAWDENGYTCIKVA